MSFTQHREIGEIFTMIEKAKSEDAVIAVLEKYGKINSSLEKLFHILYATDTEFSYARETVPPYRPAKEPYGYTFTTLRRSLNSLHFFFKVNEGQLTQRKRDIKLIQLLEAMHADEATYLVRIVTNEFYVENLTRDIVFKVYPKIQAAFEKLHVEATVQPDSLAGVAESGTAEVPMSIG